MKTLEEIALEYINNNVFCNGITPFELEIADKAFIAGAQYQAEEMEKLKDFEVWKEWKDTKTIKLK